jgi:predicted dinucleotide-binding enzyme
LILCADDDAAKADVVNLLKHCGWESIVDYGDITGSRILEPLALAWIVNAFRTGNFSSSALALLTK